MLLKRVSIVTAGKTMREKCVVALVFIAWMSEIVAGISFVFSLLFVYITYSFVHIDFMYIDVWIYFLFLFLSFSSYLFIQDTVARKP